MTSLTSGEPGPDGQRNARASPAQPSRVPSAPGTPARARHSGGAARDSRGPVSAWWARAAQEGVVGCAHHGNPGPMRALQFPAYGGPEVLSWADAPDPHAGAGQIRIAVRAASVNPADW